LNGACHSPEVEVVVARHASKCIARNNPNRLGQCRCPKYFYIRRDRLRISARTKSWETAREKAIEYAHANDSEIIAKRAELEEKHH
jgi:hypothetical protein